MRKDRTWFPPAIVWLCAGLGDVASGCSSGPPSGSAMPDMAYVSNNPLIVARPYHFAVPASYEPAKAYPLVVLLHGEGESGVSIDGLTGLGDTVNARQFLYADPDARPDDAGSNRWNCCHDVSGPDDVAYLDAVIADMSKGFHVDSRRIFVIGHGSGAAMAYRYACDRAASLGGVIGIAGTYSTDPAVCVPRAQLSQLQIIGDADPAYPGSPPVRTTSQFWAQLDACSINSDPSAPPLDIDAQQPGAETSVEKWTGCARGTAVEFWLIHGAAHHPVFQKPGFANTIIDWLNGNVRR